MKALIFFSLLFLSQNSHSITRGDELSRDQLLDASVVAITVDLNPLDRGQKRTNFCTGIILNSKNVLTAAHCFPKRGLHERRIVRVTLATHALGEFLFEETIQNSQIVFHPKSRSQIDLVDLAIIHLSDPLPPFVKSAELITEKIDIDSHSQLILVGYGAKSLTSGSSTSETIGQLRSSSASAGDLTIEANLLKLSQQNLPGVCSGDSGSPISVELNGRRRTVGVAVHVAHNLTASEVEFRNRFGLEELLRQNPKLDMCQGHGYFQRIDLEYDWIKANS